MKQNIVFPLLAVLMVFGTVPVYASEAKKDDQQDAEAKEAADETEAEAKQDEMERKLFTGSGKLNVFSEDAPEKLPGVFGAFSTSDGKIYLVKVADPAVQKMLEPLDHKNISLIGKLRNKGKYLVVENILPDAPPVEVRRRRGGI